MFWSIFLQSLALILIIVAAGQGISMLIHRKKPEKTGKTPGRDE